MLVFHNKREFAGWRENEVWEFAARKACESQMMNTVVYPISKTNIYTGKAWWMGFGLNKKDESAAAYAVRGLVRTGVLIKIKPKGKEPLGPKKYWHAEYEIPEGYERYT